jgi:hypothetical protein
VIKAHIPDVQLADRSHVIFSSYRDLRDVAASGKDFGISVTPEDQQLLVASARACDEFWSPRADLIVRYDDIVWNPSVVLSNIAATLRVNFSAGDGVIVTKSLMDMKSPAGGNGPYDRGTLLHARHRFDGRPGRWRETLDSTVARTITEVHRDWLGAHGYLSAADLADVEAVRGPRQA